VCEHCDASALKAVKIKKVKDEVFTIAVHFLHFSPLKLQNVEKRGKMKGIKTKGGQDRSPHTRRG
jgi:hypothetical protein